MHSNINLWNAPVDENTELFTSSGIASDAIIQRITERYYADLPARNIPTEILRADGHCIQEDMSKYLAASEHYQSSHLKDALITPLHFDYNSDQDAIKLAEIEGEGNHFNLGTFLHQCILEPTRFGRAIVEPKWGLNTTEGVDAAIRWYEEKAGIDYGGWTAMKIVEKRSYLEQIKKLADIDPVTKDNHLRIQIIKKHLDHYAGGIVYHLVKRSKREISFYGDLEGIPIKVRPDAIQFEENIGVNAIISIKSTACYDLRSFYTFCAKYHYDLSEALYQDVVSKVTGRDFSTTITIMLQTTSPYAVAVMVWDRDDIEVGRYKYKTALATIAKAKADQSYPGFETKADNELGIIEMKLPDWNGREFLPG